MKTNREVLFEIFGEKMPDGATSCSTFQGIMSFLIGRTAEFVDVPMTTEQKIAVANAGLLGTFGQTI